MESGVRLSARYAFPPNKLGYCGKKSFQKAFSEMNDARLERELKKFRAHYAYLRLIARCNGLKPFDARVAEALWIGNELLEKVGEGELRKFVLEDFVGPGMLTMERAGEIAGRVAPGCSPHHSFHSLFVGSVSGRVRRTLRNTEHCLVRWGKVRESDGENAVVETRGMRREGKKLVLGAKRVEECRAPFERVRPGDWVSLHWGHVIQKLSERQREELEKWTRRNLNAFNAASRA